MCVFLLCRFASAFRALSPVGPGRSLELTALKRVVSGSAAPIQEPGKNIPEEIANQQCIYDMVLVERVSVPATSSGGLFMPQVEGQDKKLVGLVLNMPLDYGLESEGGRIQSIEEIMPFKVGDYILLKDPWGIGPKDQPVGDRFFSFVKAERIGAVFRK